MKLLFDTGGTRLTFAAVDSGSIVNAGAMAWADMSSTECVRTLVDAFPWLASPFISLHQLKRPTPPAAPADWFGRLAENMPWDNATCRTLDPVGEAPFDIAYGEGQAGADRIAAAVACHAKDAGGSFIIIDAGTCITVDLLSPGVWRGGAIMPGLALQAAAAHRAGLPEIRPSASGAWEMEWGAEGALGQDTEGALKAGIPWSIRQSVGALARALKELDPCAQVVLTGGDAGHFDGLEGWQTFADPNLVLQGGALLLNTETP